MSKLGTYNVEALGQIASPLLDEVIADADDLLAQPGLITDFHPDHFRALVLAAKLGRDFCRAEIARQLGSFS